MKKINIEELATLLKGKIQGISQDINIAETGVVVSVADGIAIVYGLQNAMISEVVTFDNGAQGIILNLEEDNVGVAIFSRSESVFEGMHVVRTAFINQFQLVMDF